MLLYFIVPDTCEIDPLSYALSVLWYHYYNTKIWTITQWFPIQLFYTIKWFLQVTIIKDMYTWGFVRHHSQQNLFLPARIPKLLLLPLLLPLLLVLTAIYIQLIYNLSIYHFLDRLRMLSWLNLTIALYYLSSFYQWGN